MTSQRYEEIREKKRQIERVHSEFKAIFDAGESDEEPEEPPTDTADQQEETKVD